MLVLSEENNKLVLFFDGFDDCYILDEYDEQYLNNLYVSYKEKIYRLGNYLFSCFINSINEKNHILIDTDTIENFDLLKEFIDKIKNIEIVIKVSNTEKVFDFITSLNEDEVNNVYINYQFNSDNASVKEYKNMIFKINSLVNTIKMLNLSELETIMVVYDVVKSNEYKKIPDALPSATRTVHNVVLGDGCVCAGFSNYFNFLLNELGIKSYPIILDYNNRNSRHQRSIVHIKDEKYGVEGMYMFDPTYDCKKDDKFINNYDYFLQSVSCFKNYFSDEYIDSSSLGNHDVFSFLDITDKDLENMELIDLAKLNKTICYLNRMCDKNNDCYSMFDLEKNKKIVNKYKKLLSKEVDYKKFIDLLFNVKQIEEKIGMINSYSTDEVINTVYKRYKNMYIKLKDIRKLLILEVKFTSDNFLFEEENKKIKEIK